MVRPSGKTHQHGTRVLVIAGLSKLQAVYPHRGVRRDHDLTPEPVGQVLLACERLLARKAQYELGGGFAGARCLVDVRGAHDGREAHLP